MKISFSKGKADKIHISIDGEYSFTVDADFWFSCGYAGRSEIDEDELEELRLTVENRRAFNKALSLLSVRDHSRKELELKLRRSANDEAIENALDRIEEMGYINDELYARRLADELLHRKALTPSAVKLELTKRGISREIADSVCENLEVDTEQALKDLLETKFASKMSDEKSRKRTFNALLRMGYSYSDIRSAMKIHDEYESDC